MRFAPTLPPSPAARDAGAPAHGAARTAGSRGAALLGRAALVAAALLACGAKPVLRLPRAPWPSRKFEVRVGNAWRPLWTTAQLPALWPAAGTLPAGTPAWQALRPGVEWAELRVHVEDVPWNARIELVRLDPARLRFDLVAAGAPGAGGVLTRGWNLAATPGDALFACNAGQFEGARPWGWLVRGGREVQPPGRGALSAAVVWDARGAVAIVAADSLAALRRGGGTALAFQTFPVALLRGRIPAAWCGPDPRVSGTHRDTRFGLGRQADGRLVLALTRLDGPPALAQAPIGPTAPEMAALMGALGCPDAVMLDGGLSAQMLVRDARGRAHTWAGLRDVPLALVARPR